MAGFEGAGDGWLGFAARGDRWLGTGEKPPHPPFGHLLPSGRRGGGGGGRVRLYIS
jgi:hypothetical protein